MKTVFKSENNKEIDIQKNVTIITGNFGSGKTEVAVNLTINIAKHIEKIHIVDLDIVNPYFRCREAKKQMEVYKNIEVVIPDIQYFYADLPIVTPKVKTLFEDEKSVSIFDLGGDNTGANICKSFSKSLKNVDYDLFYVVNAKRPFTDTVDGCIKIMKEIELSSSLKISGLIGNTHLVDETDKQTIYEGITLAKSVSKKLNIPIKFISIMDTFLKDNDFSDLDLPILKLQRIMLPPWQKGEDLLGITNLNPINNIKGA